MQEKVIQEKLCYDRCVDYAVDMAAKHLAVYEDGRLTVDYKGAVEVFFNNLAAGMGILDNPTARGELSFSVPLVLVTDREGYYLWHFTEEKRHCWDAKVYFSEESQKTRAEIIEEVLRECGGNKNSFFLPAEDENFWLRSITEPGIFVYVQGLPLSAAGAVYERCSFAGAEIYKRQR